MSSAAGFLERIGAVIVRPRRALEQVARGAGGLSDVFLLVGLRLVAGELPTLARAVAAAPWLGARGAMGIALRAVSAVLPDLVGIMGGAVVMALFAGRKGSAGPARGRELDVASYAWVPYLVVRLVAALLFTALGRAPSPSVDHALDGIGLAWSAVVWGVGLWVLRSIAVAPASATASAPSPSPSLSPSPLPSQPALSSQPTSAVGRGGPRLAGAGVLVALGVLFALNGAWVARRWSSMRPVGTDAAAPDFKLPLLGGGEFHLRDDATSGPTVIDFWATWCGPCRQELPSVNRLWMAYRDRGVRVIAVDAEAGAMAPVAEELKRRMGLELPIAVGGQSVADSYQVDSLPHVVVLGARGETRRVLVGLHPEAELRAAVDEALRD